jgi:hypothetical protein
MFGKGSDLLDRSSALDADVSIAIGERYLCPLSKKTSSAIRATSVSTPAISDADWLTVRTR